MFKHFIITRFNLRNNFYSVDKNKTPILTHEWQRHRMDIFRKYCFPSIKNQTNQNFIWLVYFDDESPDFVMAAIEELKKEYANFYPKFLSDIELVKTSVLEDMKTFFSADTKHVITSDIDNDDALHKDFTKEIQAVFVPSDLCVIAPVQGYCLQVEPGFVISFINFLYSPFVTLIEPVTNYKTVMVRNHNHWFDVPTIKLEKHPLWMQIIHKKNIVNSLLVEKYIYDNGVINDFSINPAYCDFGVFYKMKILMLTTKMQLKNLAIALGFRKIKQLLKS